MTPWWHTRQWRMIQTNLREIDMLDIDAQQVVSDMQDFRANVLLLNAAGIIASYRTQLPFHFQSPFLKGDSLQEIVTACHAADIRVMARTDFSKVRRPHFEQHPEWAYRTVDGDIVDYNGDVHVCINGPYQQEYMPRIMDELFSEVPFDGIFFNMGGYQTRDYSGNYYGICHCQHCQAAFGEMYGMALPDAEDVADPVFRAYQAFKRQTLAQHHETIFRFINGRWPNMCIANHTEFRFGFIRQESNTAIERPLPHWQYNASDNTKWAVGSFPEMVSSNTTVDFIDFPYRHVTVSPEQQRLRLAQNLANGGALDYYLIGRLDNHEDRCGFDAVKDVFHYHAANEETYTDIASKAQVMLLKARINTGEYRGWFRVLVENHVLFDVVREDAAEDVSWDHYSAIVVPGVDTMTDALADRLDAFAEAGGTLVVTGRSGFFDENHTPREVPALESLGIEDVLHVREDSRSSYLRLVDKAGFSRFDETELVYVDGVYVFAAYDETAEARMRLIPPHNFGPPERCYYDLVVDHPGLVVHPYGAGRAIYVPWMPGTLFHRQGHVNTAWFCADLLEGFAGVSPVGGNLSPMVEVTLAAKQDGSYLLLSLVNTSGHFGNSFYAPVPMVGVEVAMPLDAAPAAVYGLRSKQALPYIWDDGVLTVTVTKLELFEAIRIDVA